MKRSFSEETATRVDRDFEIGGEVFKWRELGWDDFKDLIVQEETFAAKEEATTLDNLDFLTTRILFFLDPANEGHKRFKVLLKRKTHPVPHFQIQELHDWLWEEISTRPTSPLSASSNGLGSTEATSPDESP